MRTARQAELPEIKREVEAAVRAALSNGPYPQARVEVGEARDGWEFLRVYLLFDDPDAVPRDTYARARDAIRERLAELDDRFPSIRIGTLAEAAQ